MNLYFVQRMKAVALTTAILLIAPHSAHATLLGCTTDPMVITMTNSMLSLSTSIGTMADRILTTEDKIGQMADRIISSESLLASTLLQFSQSNGVASGKPGVLLLMPTSGDVVSRAVAPTLQLSDYATSYVLYVSETNDFSNNRVVPILVTPQASLQAAWQRAVQSIPGKTIYIAVRSVSGQSNLSEMSNGVQLSLP